MRKCVLQRLQALWQVAPPGSTSVTKACVNLPQAGGLVLRARLCPAFFPLEVAGTGASGHFLPRGFCSRPSVSSRRLLLLFSVVLPSAHPPKTPGGHPSASPTFSRHGPLAALIDPSQGMCPRPSTSLLLLGPGHHSSRPGSLQQLPNRSAWPQAPSPLIHSPHCSQRALSKL